MRRALLAFAVGLTLLVSDAMAAGPWRGQIIDAVSGQPLQGVVVLAFWTTSEAGLAGWAATEYHASEEVVTGPDGRFVIRSRWAYTIPLIMKVQGPDWRFFKPGYGGWPGRGGWPYVAPGDWDRFNEGVSITLKLVPLRTKVERVDALRENLSASIVPSERKPRLLEAINAESDALGLPRQGR